MASADAAACWRHIAPSRPASASAPKAGGWSGRMCPRSSPTNMAAREPLLDRYLAGIPISTRRYGSRCNRRSSPGYSPTSTGDWPWTVGFSEPAAPSSMIIAAMPTARFISDLSPYGESVAMPHYTPAGVASETFGLTMTEGEQQPRSASPSHCGMIDTLAVRGIVVDTVAEGRRQGEAASIGDVAVEAFLVEATRQPSELVNVAFERLFSSPERNPYPA